jgi:hypothetical protein
VIPTPGCRGLSWLDPSVEELRRIAIYFGPVLADPKNRVDGHSPSVPQRVDEQAERGRGLPPVRIVQVVA